VRRGRSVAAVSRQRAPAWVARLSHPVPSVVPVDRRARGATGEDQAAAWYVAHGYEVVERNWRCRLGEVDLVLYRGGTLVFCEVKARRTDRFGTGAEAVTAEKRQRLRLLAGRYLGESAARPSAVRFDVASVLGGDLEVIEAAF
jgi:putative endonuclease